MRRVFLALGLALTLISCSSGDPLGDPSLISDPVDGGFSSQRAAPRKVKTSPSASDLSPAPSTIRFAIRDQHGNGVSDVPILLRRESKKTVERLTSGPGGSLILKRPAGIYHVTIPAGCAGRREINEGRADDRFGVTEGGDQRVNLQVKTRRRYVGGSPLRGSVNTPWPVGSRVTVSMLLYDRCKDVDAPNTRFDDLRWRGSSNLKVASTGSMRSDGRSIATVVVRCTAKGDASLFLQDKESPKDRIDLLSLQPPSGFDPDAQWCG